MHSTFLQTNTKALYRLAHNLCCEVKNLQEGYDDALGSDPVGIHTDLTTIKKTEAEKENM